MDEEERTTYPLTGEYPEKKMEAFRKMVTVLIGQPQTCREKGFNCDECPGNTKYHPEMNGCVVHKLLPRDTLESSKYFKWFLDWNRMYNNLNEW